MTDEQINRAIAEACGWTDIMKSHLDGWNGAWAGKKDSHVFRKLPDYCNDLNAMHEAETVLTEEQFIPHYISNLATATASEWSDDRSYICATARQRAEAFLRTLGKWEEARR